MSKGVKVMLIIMAAGFFLFLGTVGVGVYLLQEMGPGLMENVERLEVEAKNFATGKKSQDCVDRSMLDGEECGPELFKCNVRVGSWLAFCLGAAEKTPGFCDGVPPEISFSESTNWQANRCELHPRLDPQVCQFLQKRIQNFCHRADTAQGPPNNASTSTSHTRITVTSSPSVASSGFDP